VSEASLDELIAEAEMGREASAFLEGNLGQFLIGCAAQEVMAAQEALEKVDPEDMKAVRALQNKAWLGRKFREWLEELVSKGKNAEDAFKQQQNED
jgi:hypothetical protein